MASKRKELPDLRQRGYTSPEGPDENGRVPVPPTKEKMTALGKRHRIPPSFDLADQLEWRWFWWRASDQIGPAPRGAERRDFLFELARRAEQLEEAISKAGGVERGLIFDTFPPSRLDIDRLARDAHNLAIAAKVASRHVTPSRAGARGNVSVIELLCKLWRIYREALGPNAPRISREGTRYGGPFFDFAQDVLELFAARRMSNASLGKAIQKAQAAVTARDAEAGMP